MKTFKLHKGFSEIPILLTKENYEEATKGDDNYTKIIETGKSTAKRYLAICPSSDCSARHKVLAGSQQAVVP